MATPGFLIAPRLHHHSVNPVEVMGFPGARHATWLRTLRDYPKRSTLRPHFTMEVSLSTFFEDASFKI